MARKYPVKKTRVKPRSYAFERLGPDCTYEIYIAENRKELEGSAYFIRGDYLIDDTIRILRTSKTYKHHAIYVSATLRPYIDKELLHEIQ